MSAEAHHPATLAVDLDGTLVRSDLFAESLLTLVRGNPLAVFSILLWLFSGRALLKRRIAERVRIDPAALPYLAELLQFVREEHASGRRTVLATGSDQGLAQPVADFLGCFDSVVASDGIQNRTGRRKLERLQELCGEPGFDYIGNSAADLPVWRGARCALLAARNERQARTLGRQVAMGRVFYYPQTGHSQWATLLHLRQWVWNLLVFLPGLLMAAVGPTPSWPGQLGLYLALSLCASGILLGVDLLNVTTDRGDPQRCDGPLPAGHIYLLSAFMLAPALLLAGLLVGLATQIGPVLVYSLLLFSCALWDGPALRTAPSKLVLGLALPVVGFMASVS